jgi:hypothetical protein
MYNHSIDIGGNMSYTIITTCEHCSAHTTSKPLTTKQTAEKLSRMLKLDGEHGVLDGRYFDPVPIVKKLKDDKWKRLRIKQYINMKADITKLQSYIEKSEK